MKKSMVQRRTWKRRMLATALAAVMVMGNSSSFALAAEESEKTVYWAENGTAAGDWSVEEVPENETEIETAQDAVSGTVLVTGMNDEMYEETAAEERETSALDEQADTKEKETKLNSAADGELYQELSDEEGESGAIPIHVGDIINVDNKYEQWFYFTPTESWEYVVETSGDMRVNELRVYSDDYNEDWTNGLFFDETDNKRAKYVLEAGVGYYIKVVVDDDIEIPDFNVLLYKNDFSKDTETLSLNTKIDVSDLEKYESLSFIYTPEKDEDIMSETPLESGRSFSTRVFSENGFLSMGAAEEVLHLTGGETYYICIQGRDIYYEDEPSYIYFYHVPMVKSIEVLEKKTDFLFAMESLTDGADKIKIVYDDETSEEVEHNWLGALLGKYGHYIEYEIKDKDNNIISKPGQPIRPRVGNYTVTLFCGNASVSYSITIHSLSEKITEEIKSGQVLSVSTDTVHYYKFVPTESGRYFFHSSAGLDNGGVDIYDEEGRIDGIPGSGLILDSYVFTLIKNKTYYLQIRCVPYLEKSDILIRPIYKPEKVSAELTVANINKDNIEELSDYRVWNILNPVFHFTYGNGESEEISFEKWKFISIYVYQIFLTGEYNLDFKYLDSRNKEINFNNETPNGTYIVQNTIAGIKMSNEFTISGNADIRQYKVNLDCGGGTASPSNMTVTYGSTYGTIPVPTRQHYRFLGWYTSKNGGIQITSASKVDISDDHTLYARWSGEAYNADFDAAGGSLNVKSKTIIDGEAYGALPTPTRQYYEFLGWYTSKSGGSRVTADTKVLTGGNHTLYARWIGTAYKVSYNVNGGKSSVKSKLVNYGSAYGTLTAPVRKGYKFKGWYTSKKGGKKVTSATGFTTAKNITLYARWDKISVKKIASIQLKNKKSKQVTGTIKRVRGVKGYQIVYGLNKSVTKGKKSFLSTSTKFTINKLKKGRTYYVKARGYAVDSAGRKVYGSYSAVKSLKIKK